MVLPWMFGDTQIVVSSSTIPASVLKKRHNALSCHAVCAAIAAGYVKFNHINGVDNPTDILTKYLEPYKVEKITKPFLFWQDVLPDWPPAAKKQKATEIKKINDCQDMGSVRPPSITSFNSLYANL